MLYMAYCIVVGGHDVKHSALENLSFELLRLGSADCAPIPWEGYQQWGTKFQVPLKSPKTASMLNTTQAKTTRPKN